MDRWMEASPRTLDGWMTLGAMSIRLHPWDQNTQNRTQNTQNSMFSGWPQKLNRKIQTFLLKNHQFLGHFWWFLVKNRHFFWKTMKKNEAIYGLFLKLEREIFSFHIWVNLVIFYRFFRKSGSNFQFFEENHEKMKQFTVYF